MNFKIIAYGYLLVVSSIIQAMSTPAAYSSQPSKPAAVPSVVPAAPITTLYTLEIPVPGTPYSVAETINLKEIQEPIAASTLDELFREQLQETGGFFILARVTTKLGDTYGVEYYSLENINKALFKGLYPTPTPDEPIARYTFFTPLRAPIVGEIHYFIFNFINNRFEHIATDTDLYTIAQNSLKHHALSERQQFIINIITAVYSKNMEERSNAFSATGNYFYKKNAYQSARAWLIKAAQLGNTIAMNSLGFMDQNGHGLAAPNYQSAHEWYTKAAQLGNPVAMSNLGSMDIRGQGLPAPNYQSARKWYTKAAQLGNPVAMSNLGSMDAKGQGLPAPNYQSAHEWYTKALATNPPPELKAAIEKYFATLHQHSESHKQTTPESTRDELPAEKSTEQPSTKKQK